MAFASKTCAAAAGCTPSSEKYCPNAAVGSARFGNDGTAPDTTSDPIGALKHQFADTGTYTIKLKVILAGQCYKSASHFGMPLAPMI